MSISKKYFFHTSKYGAKKTTVGDRTYDSKKEARRALALQTMQNNGLITNLKEQQPFLLQEGYINNKGKRIRPIIYVADFTYIKNGKMVVEDCKGMKTDVYKLKKKIFEHEYPQYDFIES